MFSQDKFRAALLEWVLVCNQAFTAPEQEAFVKMVRTLNPKAKTISDKTVRSDLMAAFGKKFDELKKEIRLIPGKISITMDGWTSKNFLSFLAIRGHWLDAEWIYQSKLLDFSYIEGGHTGMAFSELLNDCLTRLEIPFSRILGITLDNASNNDTMFQYLAEISEDISEEEIHIRCLAHVINLSAQDILALLKIPDVDEYEDFDFVNEVNFSKLF